LGETSIGLEKLHTSALKVE